MKNLSRQNITSFQAILNLKGDFYMENKEFIMNILNDEYITWLSNFMGKYDEFDDCYFKHSVKGVLSRKDEKFIDDLKILFDELNKYSIKTGIINKNTFCYLLKYNDKIYEIYDNADCYCCNISEHNDKISIIDYNQFKKYYQTMVFNFALLKDRVSDALYNTDLDYINSELSKLCEPTLLSGVGGSNVVSQFGAKVINVKNNIVSINCEPRDFLYQNNKAFKNVISCSYSGNNYGVELSFKNQLKKYLLSNNSFNDSDVIYLKYNTNIPKENSFISLGATLIPISILLNYYLDGDDDLLLDCINEPSFDLSNNIYEIYSGYDTSAASKYLESTMVESGIGIPIVHDKYSFCHGRSNLGHNYSGTAIYYNKNTEFDKMILEELKKYYSLIVIIDSKFKDQILDDYHMLIQSMYLTKYIAKKNSMDLSKTNYSPLVKKLYRYNKQI